MDVEGVDSNHHIGCLEQVEARRESSPVRRVGDTRSDECVQQGGRVVRGH